MKLLFLIAIALFFSCGLKIPTVTDFSEFIPSDFNKNNDTLLFVNSNLFQAPIFRKKLKESYTGNFLVIPKIKNESVEHCRYIMFENVDVTTITTIYSGLPNNNPVIPGNKTSKVQYSNSGFTIFDRKTGKSYHNNTQDSKTNFANYLKALDEARMKN